MLLQGANAGLSSGASAVQQAQGGDLPTHTRRDPNADAGGTSAHAARRGSALRIDADDTSLFYRDPREAQGAGLKLDPAARSGTVAVPESALPSASSGVSETLYLGRLSGLVRGE